MRHSLIPLYKKMHLDAHFSGISTYAYVEQIADLVKASGAKTLLDYGSGKGRQYYEGRAHELWGIMPTLYDPAVSGIDVRPQGKFDGVICVDVMEHVPEDEVAETLRDIRDYANMWAFFSICPEPAKKSLPDGRNVHVTLHEPAWWLSMINGIFAGVPEAHVYFERGDGAKTKPPTAQKIPREERVRRGWCKP